MSIIAGAVDGGPDGGARHRVSAMMVGLAARYPDGLVIRGANRAALALGRLVTTEQQSRPDGEGKGPDVIAVVDGRLDDAATLASELSLPASVSDADLVVAGYRRWDLDVVARLRGDFALLIWDDRSSRLVAARDPLGVRPLFYARHEGWFLAASDPEQLLAAGVPAIPDDHSVVEYLLWGFDDLERSFFRDIRRVPAGHVLVSNSSGITLKDYRSPPKEMSRSTGTDTIDAGFRDAFNTAVRRRLRSTGPCVLHLSGGLDSSSIVCAADRLASSDPTLSPGIRAAASVHPGLPCDEEVFIAAVEASIQFPVERWDGTAALPTELEDVPLALPGARFSMTGGTEGDIEIARRIGSRVVLSGSGGDQLGIPTGALLDAIVQGRWRDARRFLFAAPGASRQSTLTTLLRTTKSLAPAWLRHAYDRLRTPRATRPAWLHEGAWKEWRPRPHPAKLPDGLGSHIRRRHWRTIVEPRHMLSAEIFQMHGTRNQVELRFPFMDWDLVLYALSIPSSYWPPPWPQERLHRRPLAGLLPRAVVDRRTKAEFSSALANRVRSQLPFIRAMFLAPGWGAERYVRQRDAQRALATFEESPRPSFSATWAVWGIATLEAWLRRLSRYTATPKPEAQADGRRSGNYDSDRQRLSAGV